MFWQPTVLTRNSAPLVLLPVPCAGNEARRHFELSSRLGSKLCAATSLFSESAGRAHARGRAGPDGGREGPGAGVVVGRIAVEIPERDDLRPQHFEHEGFAGRELPVADDHGDPGRAGLIRRRGQLENPVGARSAHGDSRGRQERALAGVNGHGEIGRVGFRVINRERNGDGGVGQDGLMRKVVEDGRQVGPRRIHRGGAKAPDRAGGGFAAVADGDIPLVGGAGRQPRPHATGRAARRHSVGGNGGESRRGRLHGIGKLELTVGIGFVLPGPGRIAEDPHGVRGRREAQEPQEAIAAVAAELVIRNQGADGVAVEDILARAFAVHMAAKHEEQVGIGLEGVVDGAALRAEGRTEWWAGRCNGSRRWPAAGNRSARAHWPRRARRHSRSASYSR